MSTTVISWFEIPTTDLARAQKFYETIFGIRLSAMDTPMMKMRMFSVAEDPANVQGALVDSGGFHKPSPTDGPLLYLNANPDVQKVLTEVEAAGGKVLVPKTEVSPEHGHIAVFIDTEGNRIGIHSVPTK
jgi:predicted enzyme related to lactoylglutathione lyase